jgi:hypothetical protein
VDEGPGPGRDDAVAWGIKTPSESRWPALLAILAAIALQLVLPDNLILGLGNRDLIPASESALIIVLLVTNPGRISREEIRLRVIGVSLIALATVTNVISLVELLHALLYGSKAAGRPLVYASVPIWLTNVIVFGLWYWELDRGGPAARQSADVDPRGVAGVGTEPPRLLLYVVHQRHRFQPHRYDAPHPLGQDAHDASVTGLAGDRRRRGIPGREHPELTAAAALGLSPAGSGPLAARRRTGPRIPWFQVGRRA